MDAPERTILILQKDLEQANQHIQSLTKNLELIASRVDSHRDQLSSRQNDVLELWKEQSRIKLDLGEHRQTLRADVTLINSEISDRLAPELRNQKEARAKDIESLRSQISETAKDLQGLAGRLDAQIGPAIQEIKALKDSLYLENGGFVRRIASLETWKRDLVVRFGVIVAIAAPIWGIGVFLIGRWIESAILP